MRVPELAAMSCEYRFFSVEYFLASAERNGFAAAELWCGPMHFFLDYQHRDSVEALRSLAERHGVRIVAVCPEQTNPKPANMTALSAEARRRTYQYFCNVIDVAAQLGAGIVTATTGWGLLNESMEDALGRSLSMLREVASYAQGRNVTLALEALQTWESNLPCHTSAELARVLDEVGSPALKACLDTGAMAAAGETIPDYFANLGADVVHCHFVDSGEETHVVWGEGTRSMAGDLDALVACGYEGFLSVETVDPAHFENPADADARAMAMYRQYLEERQS